MRFEVTAPADLDVADCNCSICRKAGYLHLIVPAERFVLINGRSDLTTYSFNTGVAKHFFVRIAVLNLFIFRDPTRMGSASTPAASTATP